MVWKDAFISNSPNLCFCTNSLNEKCNLLRYEHSKLACSRCLHTPTAVSAMFYCSPHQTSISRRLSSSKLPTRVSNTSGDAPKFVVDQVQVESVGHRSARSRRSRVAAAKRSHGAVVRPRDECVTAIDLVACMQESSAVRAAHCIVILPVHLHAGICEKMR